MLAAAFPAMGGPLIQVPTLTYTTAMVSVTGLTPMVTVIVKSEEFVATKRFLLHPLIGELIRVAATVIVVLVIVIAGDVAIAILLNEATMKATFVIIIKRIDINAGNHVSLDPDLTSANHLQRNFLKLSSEFIRRVLSV